MTTALLAPMTIKEAHQENVPFQGQSGRWFVVEDGHVKPTAHGQAESGSGATPSADSQGAATPTAPIPPERSGKIPTPLSPSQAQGSLKLSGKMLLRAGLGLTGQAIKHIGMGLAQGAIAQSLNLWHATHAVLGASAKVTQAIAKEVAIGKGFSEEEVNKLSKTLGALDLTFKWGMTGAGVSLAAFAPPIAIACKALAYFPAASSAYLIGSVASSDRPPSQVLTAAYRALKKGFPGTIKGAALFAWGAIRHPLTRGAAHAMALGHAVGEEAHKAYLALVQKWAWIVKAHSGDEEEIAEVARAQSDEGDGQAQAREAGAIIAAHWATVPQAQREDWLALFSVAFDDVRDVQEACAMADTALPEMAQEMGDQASQKGGYRPSIIKGEHEEGVPFQGQSGGWFVVEGGHVHPTTQEGGGGGSNAPANADASGKPAQAQAPDAAGKDNTDQRKETAEHAEWREQQEAHEKEHGEWEERQASRDKLTEAIDEVFNDFQESAVARDIVDDEFNAVAGDGDFSNLVSPDGMDLAKLPDTLKDLSGRVIEHYRDFAERMIAELEESDKAIGTGTAESMKEYGDKLLDKAAATLSKIEEKYVDAAIKARTARTALDELTAKGDPPEPELPPEPKEPTAEDYPDEPEAPDSIDYPDEPEMPDELELPDEADFPADGTPDEKAEWNRNYEDIASKRVAWKAEADAAFQKEVERIDGENAKADEAWQVKHDAWEAATDSIDEQHNAAHDKWEEKADALTEKHAAAVEKYNDKLLKLEEIADARKEKLEEIDSSWIDTANNLESDFADLLNENYEEQTQQIRDDADADEEPEFDEDEPEEFEEEDEEEPEGEDEEPDEEPEEEEDDEDEDSSEHKTGFASVIKAATPTAQASAQSASPGAKRPPWQGPSGRWFKINDAGRVVPAKNPNATDEPKKKPGKKPPDEGEQKPAKKPAGKKPPPADTAQLIADIKSGKHTDGKSLTESLMTLTVAQINDIKTQLGLKAGGAKAELAKKVAERALSGKGGGKRPDTVTPDKPEKKPSKKPDKKPSVNPPDDKPEPKPVDESGPVPPEKGFTGFDTLGRKFEDGVYKEGETEPLADGPGKDLREALRKEKALHEKVNKLARMPSIDDIAGQLKAKAKTLEAQADEMLKSIKTAKSARDRNKIYEANQKIKQEANAAYEKIREVRNNGEHKIAAATAQALAVSEADSVKAGIEDAKVKDTTPEQKRIADTALSWLNRITAKKADGSAFPAYGVDFKAGTDGTNRACYRDEKNTICGEMDIGTAVHEFAHGLEYHLSKGVQRGARQFRDHRCGSEKLVKLNQVFPDSHYKDHEIGRKDKFELAFGERSAYYAGKDYSDGATEIISMGVEKLYRDPVTFARKDPEYAAFIIGILDGTIR